MPPTPFTSQSSRLSVYRVEIAPRTLALLLGVVGGLWLALRLAPILLTLLVALILAGTLSPVVENLERRGISRTLGVAMVFTAALGVVVGLLTVTLPSLAEQLGAVISDAPAIQARLAASLSKWKLMAPLAASVRTARTPTLELLAAGHLFEYSTHAMAVAAYGASAVVLALYVVADRDRVRGMLFAVVPRAYHLRTARVLLNLEAIVGGYMRGQIVTSGLMAAFTFVLLSACGVKNALALAVFAGLTDVLPFVGGLLALAPAVAAASARGPGTAAAVLIAMLAYMEIENRLLIPKIYGTVLRLAPITVVVALLVGGELMGILGALLALPVAAGMRMAIEEFRVALPGDDTDDSSLRGRDFAAEREFAARAAGTDAAAAAVAIVMADQIRKGDAEDPAEAATVPITSGKPEAAKEGAA